MTQEGKNVKGAKKEKEKYPKKVSEGKTGRGQDKRSEGNPLLETSSNASKKKQGYRRVQEAELKKPAIDLDVSDLPPEELMKRLYENAVIIEGPNKDPGMHPRALKDWEVDHFIKEGVAINVLYDRHMGGYNPAMGRLNASLYDKFNCESQAARGAGRKVKPAQTIVQELREEQRRNEEA